jgi:hypothetical protein
MNSKGWIRRWSRKDLQGSDCFGDASRVDTAITQSDNRDF